MFQCVDVWGLRLQYDHINVVPSKYTFTSHPGWPYLQLCLKTQTMKCTAWSQSSCSPLRLWESTLRKETKWLGKSDPWKLKQLSSSWVHKNLPKKKSEGLATEGLAKSGRHNPHSSERQSHTFTLLILMSLLILAHFLSLQDRCLQFLY